MTRRTILLPHVGILQACVSKRHVAWFCAWMIALTALGCNNNDDTGWRDRRPLESIREDDGIIGRSAIPCRTGDCILLHFPPSEDRFKQFKQFKNSPGNLGAQGQINAILQILLQQDDEDESNDGQLVQLSERWGGEHATPTTLSSFNCCSYAMGDLLNLDSGDWLDTHRRHASDPIAPVQIVLDSYFQSVATYSVRNIDWQEFSQASGLQQNDLICFAINMGKKYRCVHIGFAKQNGSAFWMESKIGIGPVVLATIEATARGYTRQFDQVIVFRRSR